MDRSKKNTPYSSKKPSVKKIMVEKLKAARDAKK